ncbi:MAG: PEP-CTERM sorting domain-containing protein [Rhizobiales bacterium]|nr:PEP-CTERM sorting domain-containing protein [Rhizobacter sp.]
MTRFLIAPIAIACTLLGATQARADNVSFSGFANGSKSVNIVLASPNAAKSLTTDAGGFSASLNDGPSFTTYCIDLYEYIGIGSTYTDYTLVAGASHAFANTNAVADIGKLYAENNLIANATAQAAFQIAIWEIAYETTGAYNLGTGAAKFSGGTAASSGALTMASNWLTALSTTTNSGYTVWALDSIGKPGHQDQVFAAPVPEPSTYALMAGGLLAMGFFARRRASRQG